MKNLRTTAKAGVIVFAPLVAPGLLLCGVAMTLYVVAETTYYVVFGERK